MTPKQVQVVEEKPKGSSVTRVSLGLVHFVAGSLTAGPDCQPNDNRDHSGHGHAARRDE
jgi:hypothetical protein